jgi:hypothetical protein
MNILLAMTGDAGIRQFDFSCYFLNVTGQTINILMRTIQLVIRVNVVFKLPQGPVIRVMTQLTVRAQVTFMYIIRLMTNTAFTRCRLVCRCQMALLARGNCMQTEKREIGHIVFETHFPAPTMFVMAFFTTLPLLTLVNIVRPMTTQAVRCKFFLVNLTPVTG